MSELISIVVPVFDVEPYLVECINSILNQTYANLEIILVDDGSSDGSSKICDSFEKKEDRVKVIHQKNGGLTLTRRAGVNAAQGQYIGFVDGDDWIECNMYQVLYDYVCNEKVDIVTSRGYREYLWGTSENTLGDTIPSGKYKINEEGHYILTHVFPGLHGKKEFINGAVWNKLFRANIIRNVLNEVDDHVHGLMDDTVCVVGAIMQAESIYISKDILYHHREREGAFTYSKNFKGLLQTNYGYLSLKKMIDRSCYKDKMLPDLFEFVANTGLEAYNNMMEGERYNIPQYFFKSEKISESSKVLLYGAGKVGKSYWRQLKAEGKYELLGIIDKRENLHTDINVVYGLEYINQFEFDYIIIAVKNLKTVKEIQKQLVNQYVRRDKIIWEHPLSIFEYFKEGRFGV